MRGVNLAGQRFGRLQAIGESTEPGRKIKWVCLCDCGEVSTVNSDSLRRGHTSSCGCLTVEQGKMTGSLKKHGHYVGGKASPTYKSW